MSKWNFSAVCVTFLILMLVASTSLAEPKANLHASFKAYSNGSRCAPSVDSPPFSLSGPGYLHLKMTISQWWDGEVIGRPLVYWKGYSSAAWGGAYPNGIGPVVYEKASGPAQNGKYLALEQKLRVHNKMDFVAASIAPVCKMYGVSGFTQWGQDVHLTLDFEPDQPAAAPPISANPTEKVLLSNENYDAVSNRPPKVSLFSVKSPKTISFIQVYHWNNGRGTVAPGQIQIRDWRTDKVIAACQARGAAGHLGVTNVFWRCENIRIALPVGEYYIFDTDVSTQSYNAGTNNCPMVVVKGF